MARKLKPGRTTRKQPAINAQTHTVTEIQLSRLQNTNKQDQQTDRLQTSPDLFVDGKTTTRMASALPIWEASSILTQRKDLPWSNDSNGKLCYTRDAENCKGAVYFWVTEDLERESPATLAGAAALAVIDAFDIRAACMHLIYAAHATQLDRPWEQEFVIDDRQIEEYLGLKKRTDKNRQQKLALIEEIAQQACKITTFVSWPTQSKVKGFTLEEGRLWHLLGTRYHYQQDIFGNKELVGITFIVRSGLWARYFLNEEGHKNKSAYCQHGTLSKALLEDVMSVWQHHEGAARLMVWLLFKTKVDRQHPLVVQGLMEIAYGYQRVQVAKQDSQLRKKLANIWDEDLLSLHERGWYIHFDLDTYPQEIQPPGFGRGDQNRPRGFFERLLSACIWISPPENLTKGSIIKAGSHVEAQQAVLQAEVQYTFSGAEIKTLRIAKGWSQRQLSALTGLSQGLISLIENNERSLTAENQEILEQIFAT
ncbi:MAG: helix-turn-helix domain-containing protein [Gloeocapsa sp. UFS-A4-WI-NPMV-4B04]|jgi:DNA-binding transcriptional regulator YiaG|nr:helix-turn-helix domain-containing protein [Gloeocapsa sp. UFS-A4-WI-NPMV-4B04]